MAALINRHPPEREFLFCATLDKEEMDHEETQHVAHPAHDPPLAPSSAPVSLHGDFDLFGYLDELPHDSKEHSEGDATANIDVAIPWKTSPDVVNNDNNVSDATRIDIEQLADAHQKKNESRGTESAAVNQWRVDLHLLLVSTNITLEKFHLQKWKEAFHLYKLMTEPCFHAIRLAGDDRALYECFHRAFPHEMVPKARFVSVLRSIFGIDDGVRKKARREEAALCRHLEKMQYTFELSQEGVPCVNWRLLLAALRMFQEPLLPIKAHFKWTFSVFSSSGYMELKDADTVDGSHVSQMLTHFLRNHAATRFVSERIRQAVDLMPVAPLLGNGSTSSSRISYRRFQALVQQPPLKALLERATPHTSYFEELASPIYRAFVFKHRKREHTIRTIKRLKYFHATRALRTCFHNWSQLARVRRQTRNLMVQTCGKLARVKRMWGFLQLKNHAVASIAAIEIQRMVRGYLGRCRGEDQWVLVQAAVKVQGAFRIRSHFVKHLRDVRKRNLLAIRIQRVYRGRLDRISTRKMLLEHYYTAMAQLQRERDGFRAYVRNEMAKRIQRFFRELTREYWERRSLEETFLRRKFEKEMDANAENAVRAAKRYRHDVTKAYDKLREDAEYKKKRKQIDGLEKQKVVRLRRQRQWDAFKQAREDRKAQIKLRCAAAYEQVKCDWEALIAERAHKKKLFVSQVLLLDEPGEWKSMQQELKRFIKEREKALAAKYKSSGVAVPKRELQERAQVEVVAEEEEKERRQAEEDWLKAEADFLNKLEQEEEERTVNFTHDSIISKIAWNLLVRFACLRSQMQENAEERARREKSAIRVQCAFRMFAARNMLRQEIRALFVKEFDAKRQTAVYRNTFSGEKLLRKPFGLGSEELEYPDQWFLVEDPSIGEHFYYNPLRMLQSWEKPEECRLCGSCKAQKFAAFWNAQEDAYTCQQCYDQLAKGQPGFTPDMYFPYDGACPNGY